MNEMILNKELTIDRFETVLQELELIAETGFRKSNGNIDFKKSRSFFWKAHECVVIWLHLHKDKES